MSDELELDATAENVDFAGSENPVSAAQQVALTAEHLERTRRQLYAFLSDLVEVATFDASQAANLTGIPTHEVVDLLVALGCPEISPGVFDYQASVEALAYGERHQP